MKAQLNQFIKFIRSTTGRLALSYLAIIMVMSLSFSFVFYKTSAHELGRQVPTESVLMENGFTTLPSPDFRGYRRFFESRVNEGRGDLLAKLIFLNLLTLVGGAFLSHYLARRTLSPIERALEAQSRFASDASHELRTPLAAIQTENEVALRSKDLTLKHAKELLSSNLEEVMRLRDLSDGLLRLARGDQLHVRPVWLDDIATEAINRVLKTAQLKHISIEETVPHVQVFGDVKALTQVLVALLDNAIKYSDEKAEVTVTGAKGGTIHKLAVTDHGAGIPAEQLPHIFDRFYRVDASRTKQKTLGYGLGLAIAQHIIEQHRGSIHVVSTEGKGSTFTLNFPAQAPTQK